MKCCDKIGNKLTTKLKQHPFPIKILGIKLYCITYIEVVASPDLRCVLASNRQLNDLVRFRTNPVSFSIFNLDPTFNLGNFDQYRNTMLLDKKSGKHPVFLGPLFIHQKKTFDCYNYFVSKMIGLNPAI